MENKRKNQKAPVRSPRMSQHPSRRYNVLWPCWPIDKNWSKLSEISSFIHLAVIHLKSLYVLCGYVIVFPVFVTIPRTLEQYHGFSNKVVTSSRQYPERNPQKLKTTLVGQTTIRCIWFFLHCEWPISYLSYL